MQQAKEEAALVYAVFACCLHVMLFASNALNHAMLTNISLSQIRHFQKHFCTLLII